MIDSICDVPGILVGHAQDFKGGTGCTVIISENDAVCGVDIAGGAPGTRETDCFKPVNLVQHANAVYLGGGSAFGLAGADGVMRWCEENGMGIDIGECVVPIVPGAVLFDLKFGDHKARPDSDMGYRACLAASSAETSMGNIGAGTGATIGKARGIDGVMKGGLGTASIKVGSLIVGAIAAVNCFGDIVDENTGEIIAGTRPASGSKFEGALKYLKEAAFTGINPISSNTTLGVIATNALFAKPEATKVAMMTHDGFARAINPVHTIYDGDSIFCLATGEIRADITAVGTLAAKVMSKAVINGVKAAKTAFGIPGYRI